MKLINYLKWPYIYYNKIDNFVFWGSLKMNDYDRNKQRKPERIKFLVKDYNSSIEGIRSLI